jgi:primary-amine oxidase
MAPHPFKILTFEETRIARDTVLALHPDTVVDFREIFLQEPAKESMKVYLEAEHAARPGDSPHSKRPPRLAKVMYDVVGSDKIPQYNESFIDVEKRERVKHTIVDKEMQPTLTLWEFQYLVGACQKSEEFQKVIAEFELPEGFELVIEPWLVTTIA